MANTKILTDYLDKNNIDYSIDRNPTTENVSKIKQAIERKKILVTFAVESYRILTPEEVEARRSKAYKYAF